MAASRRRRRLQIGGGLGSFGGGFNVGSGAGGFQIGGGIGGGIGGFQIGGGAGGFRSAAASVAESRSVSGDYGH